MCVLSQSYILKNCGVFFSCLVALNSIYNVCSDLMHADSVTTDQVQEKGGNQIALVSMFRSDLNNAYNLPRTSRIWDHGMKRVNHKIARL